MFVVKMLCGGPQSQQQGAYVYVAEFHTSLDQSHGDIRVTGRVGVTLATDC